MSIFMVRRLALIVGIGVCLLGATSWAQEAPTGLGAAVADRAANIQGVPEPGSSQNPPPPVAPAEAPADPSLVISDLAPIANSANSKVLEQVDQDIEAEQARLDNIAGGITSVLFTPREQERLKEAVAIYKSGNWKSIEPIPPSGGGPPSDVTPIELKIGRTLKLSGISYGDGVNWVVWLNNQRLTPKRLPIEIKSIKVFKDYVEIRWLDRLTDAEIPVRLRPNQSFNLDSRSFLPG